jgi:predicted nuclease with TOPRIM domain
MAFLIEIWYNKLMKNIIEQEKYLQQLQIENSKLQEKIALLESQKAELSAKLNWFEEHFRLNQHRLYGRSSE